MGNIEPLEVTASDVRIKVVTSALNHMDLWVTRGPPRPPLPHVPGCDVAGIVDAVGADVTHVQPGDEVVVNPGVSPLDDIVALGNDSPMGDGFMIYGEHCWGGHATFAVAPGRNVVAWPASRTWEEMRGVPAGLPDGLPDAAPLPAAGGRHGPRGRHRLGCLVRRACTGSAHGRDGRGHQPQRGEAGGGARHGRNGGVRLGRPEVAGAGRCDRERRPRHLGAVGPLAEGGRPPRRLRGTSGPKVELNLPRLFFKQIEIIGSTMGSYEEFAAVTRLVDQGVAVRIDEASSSAITTRRSPVWNRATSSARSCSATPSRFARWTSSC